jgi:UDP-glucose 4-epimerase
MRQVLITGGAGFIGSHLADRLAAQGDHVIVLDDLSTGTLENLRGLQGRANFEFVHGSVLQGGLVRRLVEHSRLVVHLAAAVGVRYILDHPLSSIRTNVEGTDIVLEACARYGRKALVASTSEVYGKNPDGALCESADSVLGPASVSRWGYATAKKLDEYLALGFAQSSGVPVVVTRFFNVVGPRQTGRYGMVLPSFVRAALQGEPIRVFGDGQQTRNFTYVGDCIDAMLGLLECPQAEGEVVNIGTAEEVSMLELARRVRRLAGSASPIVLVPYEEAYPGGGFEDMRRRVPCLCKIQELTGWSPATSLDQTIQAVVRYERERQAGVVEPVITWAEAARPSVATRST